MTYKELQEANKLIKTTDIKGKDYAEVNQRIKAFRSVYPEGFILTDLKSDDGERCVIHAKVGFYEADKYNNIELHTLGEGTAFEEKSVGYINKTSYIENCETSAIGRALAMCGFGIDTSIASKEEVEVAIAKQDASKEKISEKDAKVLEALINDKQLGVDTILKVYKAKKLTDLTKEQYVNCLAKLDKTPVGGVKQ